MAWAYVDTIVGTLPNGLKITNTNIVPDDDIAKAVTPKHLTKVLYWILSQKSCGTPAASFTSVLTLDKTITITPAGAGDATAAVLDLLCIGV